MTGKSMLKLITLVSVCVVLLFTVGFKFGDGNIEAVLPGYTMSDSRIVTLDNYKDRVLDISFGNSTSIFNTVVSLLRQDASDLHPLGISYFPAEILEGTLLYRTGGAEIPVTLEWLAFDHEFSYSFGLRYPRYGRKSFRRQPFMKGPPNQEYNPDKYGKDPTNKPKNPKRRPPNFNGRKSGSFLTFRVNKNLDRFIYLDGASAAKTSTGEMDSQKLLGDVARSKLNLDIESSDSIDEREYAELICKWGKPFGLRGIVRVEIGFEVILCDFHDSALELVSNVTLPNPGSLLNLPAPANKTKDNGWPLNDDGELIEADLTEEQNNTLAQEDKWQSVLDKYSKQQSFDWLRAGNIHNSPESRVRIDYSRYVTGLTRTYINPDPNNRRLLNGNLTWEHQLDIVDNLEKSLQSGAAKEQGTDWQQVFDSVTLKFTPMLKSMQQTFDNSTLSDEAIAMKVTTLTLNFVARFMSSSVPEGVTDGQFGANKDFAIYQYSQPMKPLKTSMDHLVWSAGVNVVTKIVDCIYAIHTSLLPIVQQSLFEDKTSGMPLSESIAESKQKLNDLIAQLNWVSLNYKCDQECGWDEICLTPSWGPGPLSSSTGKNSRSAFGKHYDDTRKRMVIDQHLQCVSVETLLNN